MSRQLWVAAPLADRLDDEKVLKAVGESLPGGAATRKDADYWQWKHRTNPAGQSLGYLAETHDAAKVVGVRAFMRWRMQAPQGDRYDCVRAVDTVTDPGFRGQGIFSKLTHMALTEAEARDVALVFNTPNANSAPGYLKMAWQVVGRLPVYIKPISYFKLAGAVLNRHRRAARGDAAEEQEFGIAELPDWRAAVQLPGFLEMAESHEADRVCQGLRTLRDEPYLAWRYGQHPHVRYRVFCLRNQAGVVEAAAVMRANIRYGLKELVLTELWSQNASPALMQRCLSRLVKRVDADYLIAHARQGSTELKALKRGMFLPAYKQGIELYSRPIALNALGVLGSSQGWDLSLGDLEMF